MCPILLFPLRGEKYFSFLHISDKRFCFRSRRARASCDKTKFRTVYPRAANVKEKRRRVGVRSRRHAAINDLQKKKKINNHYNNITAIRFGQ